MDDERLFTYEKNGITIIATMDTLVVKKNGLTIELPLEVLEELAALLQDVSHQIDMENKEMLKNFIKRMAS